MATSSMFVPCDYGVCLLWIIVQSMMDARWGNLASLETSPHWDCSHAHAPSTAWRRQSWCYDFFVGWGMLSSLSMPIVSANQFKIFHAGHRCNIEGPCSSLDNLCIADNERWPFCYLQINAFADSEIAYVCISFCCLLDTYQLVAIIW